mmetsp:Transcript_10776/g.44845  ORF Transcript_10776/g.44845 Transcript_10776/m.44845 type:complete len:267 (-) Transcript_10776:50-850(-)
MKHKAANMSVHYGDGAPSLRPRVEHRVVPRYGHPLRTVKRALDDWQARKLRFPVLRLVDPVTDRVRGGSHGAKVALPRDLRRILRVPALEHRVANCSGIRILAVKNQIVEQGLPPRSRRLIRVGGPGPGPLSARRELLLHRRLRLLRRDRLVLRLALERLPVLLRAKVHGELVPLGVVAGAEAALGLLRLRLGVLDAVDVGDTLEKPAVGLVEVDLGVLGAVRAGLLRVGDELPAVKSRVEGFFDGVGQGLLLCAHIDVPCVTEDA